MKAGRRPPQAFRLPPEETKAAPAKHPARTRPPRAPRPIPAERIEWQAEEATAGPTAPARPAAPPARRRPWGTVFFAALSAFLALAVGQWAYGLVEDLFARATWLGWTASALLALAGLAALAIAAREALALARLGTLERLQADAAHAIAADDAEAAGRVLAGLKRLYAGRADAAWGLARLVEHEGDIIDAGDRIRMAERDLIAPLDAEARRIIARAARRVTLLTTVAPHAALDIVFVAALNLKMLRELAGLYGGRPGTLGTARLARMVLGHLAVTGGLALSDTLIQQVVGRGLAGRLSARLGEGAVNGILTARIGRAALDLTRPLPFAASRPPALTDLMREVANLSPPETEGS